MRRLPEVVAAAAAAAVEEIELLLVEDEDCAPAAAARTLATSSVGSNMMKAVKSLSCMGSEMTGVPAIDNGGRRNA